MVWSLWRGCTSAPFCTTELAERLVQIYAWKKSRVFSWRRHVDSMVIVVVYVVLGSTFVGRAYRPYGDSASVLKYVCTYIYVYVCMCVYAVILPVIASHVYLAVWMCVCMCVCVCVLLYLLVTSRYWIEKPFVSHCVIIVKEQQDSYPQWLWRAVTTVLLFLHSDHTVWYKRSLYPVTWPIDRVTRIHTHMHTHIHTDRYTWLAITERITAYTHTYTYIHIYIYTYIYIHTLTVSKQPWASNTYSPKCRLHFAWRLSCLWASCWKGILCSLQTLLQRSGWLHTEWYSKYDLHLSLICLSLSDPSNRKNVTDTNMTAMMNAQPVCNKTRFIVDHTLVMAYDHLIINQMFAHIIKICRPYRPNWHRNSSYCFIQGILHHSVTSTLPCQLIFVCSSTCIHSYRYTCRSPRYLHANTYLTDQTHIH